MPGRSWCSGASTFCRSDRSTAGGYAVMVLECDEPIPDEIAGQLGSQPGIVKVTILNL